MRTRSIHAAAICLGLLSTAETCTDEAGTAALLETSVGVGSSFHYRMDVAPDDTMLLHGATTVAPGDIDAHVQTISADGTMSLDMMLSGTVSGLDAGRGAAWHPDGDILVCGGLRNAWHTDMYVTKMSRSGAVRWTTWFAGTAPSNDTCYGVAANPAGEVFATGAIRNTEGANSNGFWVAKLSADGAIQWQHVHETLEHETGFFVAPGPHGAVTFAGYRNTATEGQNALLVHYDAAGNLVWETEYNVPGVNGKDFSSDLFADALGGIYLVGQHEPEAGLTRSYIQKRRATDGSVIWSTDLASDLGKVDVRSGFLACGDVYVAGTADAGAGHHVLYTRRLATVDGQTFAEDTADLLGGHRALFVARRNPSVTCPDHVAVAGWVLGDNGQQAMWAKVDVDLVNNEGPHLPSGALPVDSVLFLIDQYQQLATDPATGDAAEEFWDAIDDLAKALDKIRDGKPQQALDRFDEVLEELEEAEEDGFDTSVLRAAFAAFAVDLFAAMVDRAGLIMNVDNPDLLEARQVLSAAQDWVAAGAYELAIELAEDGAQDLKNDVVYEGDFCDGTETEYAALVCALTDLHTMTDGLPAGSAQASALSEVATAAAHMVRFDLWEAVHRLDHGFDHLEDIPGDIAPAPGTWTETMGRIARRFVDDAALVVGPGHPDVLEAEEHLATGDAARTATPPAYGDAAEAYRKAAQLVRP